MTIPTWTGTIRLVSGWARLVRVPRGRARLSHGSSFEAIGEHRLHEPSERPVPRILDIALGEAPPDAPILLQHVGGGDAQLARVALQELLPQRGVPQHHVL